MKKSIVVIAAIFFLGVPLMAMLPEAKEWDLIKNKEVPEKVTLVGLNKNVTRIQDVDPEPESGCCAVLMCMCRLFAFHDPHTAYRIPYYRNQEN